MNFLDYLDRHWLPTSIFGIVGALSPSMLEFFADAGEVFKFTGGIIGIAISLTALAINLRNLNKKQ